MKRKVHAANQSSA